MGNILQLKITLNGASKPPIWRRILVKDSLSFYKLHYIIQDTMGWYNSHLFEFNVGGMSIGIPFEDSFDEFVDAQKIKIKKYLNSTGNRIKYIYDFGDYWEHTILVEAITPEVKGENYPRCIKGKGNCPPEDCGGIYGYYEMLQVIKDKKHPDHENMLEWLGSDFDPNEFDLEAINAGLEEYH